MKRFILILTLLIFSLQANAAMTFKEASAEDGQKAMAILVYARWAKNYDYSLETFRKIQDKLGNKYNYVELDIASEDAKEFTEKYSILPQLPYIMVIRGRGRFQMRVDRSCTSDLDCAVSRMKSFVRQ